MLLSCSYTFFILLSSNNTGEVPVILNFKRLDLKSRYKTTHTLVEHVRFMPQGRVLA